MVEALNERQRYRDELEARAIPAEKFASLEEPQMWLLATSYLLLSVLMLPDAPAPQACVQGVALE